MSVSNCIFHAPHFPARYDRNLSQGRGLFLYLWHRDERGGRVVLMLISLSPFLFSSFLSFLSFFFFFSLLITVHDRHAEREESNYGMVGEDISPRVGERKKRISRGCLWAVRGGDIFFFYKNLTYLFIVYGLSQFLTMHSIWLINILTFSP